MAVLASDDTSAGSREHALNKVQHSMQFAAATAALHTGGLNLNMLVNPLVSSIGKGDHKRL